MLKKSSFNLKVHILNSCSLMIWQQPSVPKRAQTMSVVSSQHQVFRVVGVFSVRHVVGISDLKEHLQVITKYFFLMFWHDLQFYTSTLEGTHTKMGWEGHLDTWPLTIEAIDYNHCRESFLSIFHIDRVPSCCHVFPYSMTVLYVLYLLYLFTFNATHFVYAMW